MEHEGETSDNVYVSPQVDNDKLTYETPNTKVHPSVFVTERLGDTIPKVTSPKSREKKRVWKRALTLCISYTSKAPQARSYVQTLVGSG